VIEKRSRERKARRAYWDPLPENLIQGPNIDSYAGEILITAKYHGYLLSIVAEDCAHTEDGWQVMAVGMSPSKARDFANEILSKLDEIENHREAK